MFSFFKKETRIVMSRGSEGNYAELVLDKGIVSLYAGYGPGNFDSTGFWPAKEFFLRYGSLSHALEIYLRDRKL